MNTAHTSNRQGREYQPTIIESGVLLRRLVIQISFLKNELRRSWIDCKQDPVVFGKRSIHDLYHRLKNFLTSPNVVPACATAVVTVACFVILVLLFEKTAGFRDHAGELNEPPEEVVLLDVGSHADGIGRFGQGRVGFNAGSGEGSGPKLKPSRGGVEEAIKVQPRSRPVNSRRLPTSLRRYRLGLRSIRRHSRWRASISIRNFGEISRLRFLVIQDRILKWSRRVPGKAEESAPARDLGSAKVLVLVLAQEKMETLEAAREIPAVVVLEVVQGEAGAESSAPGTSNKERVCYSNLSQNTLKKLAEIRSRVQ